MTDSIIVYHSRQQEVIDQMVYDQGMGAWLIPIMGAVIVGGIVWTVVQHFARQHLTYRASDQLSLMVAVVLGGATFYELALPLW